MTSYVKQCLNKDGVPIRLDITFQFKAKQSQIYDIIMDFRDFDGYKQVLTNSGTGSMKTSCVFLTNLYCKNVKTFKYSL